jgi:DNA-binding transcriptional ArsR family regulator
MWSQILSLHTFEQIKSLADPRRLQILRLLMAKPATLSQLAHALHQSPAWVRHHILALEAAGLIELSEIRKTGTVIEKFYRAKAGGFLLQELILPKSKKTAAPVFWQPRPGARSCLRTPSNDTPAFWRCRLARWTGWSTYARDCVNSAAPTCAMKTAITTSPTSAVSSPTATWK